MARENHIERRRRQRSCSLFSADSHSNYSVQSPRIEPVTEPSSNNMFRNSSNFLKICQSSQVFNNIIKSATLPPLEEPKIIIPPKEKNVTPDDFFKQVFNRFKSLEGRAPRDATFPKDSAEVASNIFASFSFW